MSFQNFSVGFAADQCYVTPATAGSPVYEASKQVSAVPIRLVNLFIFNNSAATVYAAVMDSKDAGTTLGRQGIVPFPIAAGSYVAVSTHGGSKMSSGCYVKLFTDPALTAAAGAVGFFKFDWMDYV